MASTRGPSTSPSNLISRVPKATIYKLPETQVRRIHITYSTSQKIGTQTNAMKAVAQNAKPIPKKADRIPFEEMCRLMRVYGPVKCLRNRQKSGVANMKMESVKRKFYRWFPDLDERFVRDSGGYYRPRFGHEFEMRYRLEMRTRDGETLSKKRTRRRNERLVVAARAIGRKIGHGGAGMASGVGIKQARAPLSKPPLRVVSSPSSLHGEASGVKKDCVPLPTRPLRVVSSLPSFHGEASTGCASVSPPEVLSAPALPSLLHRELIRVENHDIRLEAEPLDKCFVADVGIFEDVDRSFYASCEMKACPTIPSRCDERPRLVSSSSSTSGSEEEQGPGALQWDSIDDLLDESMNEYCEEILASSGDDLGSGFHFGSL